jgi:hypothetical protein
MAITPDCAVALAPSLQGLTALGDLNFTGWGMRGRGMAAVAPSLHSLTRLEHLELRRNKLGRAGAHLLSSALPHLVSLQYQGLRGNNIAGRACQQRRPFAGAGKEDQEPKHCEVVKALCSSMEHLSCLRILDLTRNGLGPEMRPAVLATLGQIKDHRHGMGGRGDEEEVSSDDDEDDEDDVSNSSDGSDSPS